MTFYKNFRTQNLWFNETAFTVFFPQSLRFSYQYDFFIFYVEILQNSNIKIVSLVLLLFIVIIPYIIMVSLKILFFLNLFYSFNYFNYLIKFKL